MVRPTSLLIWAALSIGGTSAGCFGNLPWPGLKVESNDGGWNGVGKGFLNMFTPEKLTDDHWEIIGKMQKNFEGSLVKEFAFSMGGIVFLIVVSVLLILLFCAAPIALCVFNCTCKKNCKPKSNAIVVYSGLGCTSLAILTIGLGIIFLFISIGSVTGGIVSLGSSMESLPNAIGKIVDDLKNQAKCATSDPVNSLKKAVEEFPSTMSTKVTEIPKFKDVMAINFEAKSAKIDDFIKTAGDMSTRLGDAITEVNKYPGTSTAAQSLSQTQQNVEEIKTKLNGQNSVKEMLVKVDEDKRKASKSEIEARIKDKTQPALDQINKVAAEVDQKIDEAFKGLEVQKDSVKSQVANIKNKIDGLKDNFGYANALNLVLFPCYLALGAALWATCQATKFVQKKKAKPREKGGLLLLLVIGFGFAFIPLLVSTVFMTSAGIVNVFCGTVFHDDSYGFLPQAFSALSIDPTIELQGTKVDIIAALQECKSGKSMISVMKGETLLDKDRVTKEFNIDAKKIEMTQKIEQISIGLPDQSQWQSINDQIGNIESERMNAEQKINILKTFQIPNPMGGSPISLVDQIPRVGEVIGDLEEFMKKVEEFEKECVADLQKAQALDETFLKAEMVKLMIGDGTDPGLLNTMLTKIDGEYQKIRTELLTHSTNCDWVFAAYKDVGAIVCDQGLVGLNGIYSAIGLAVFSLFSAAVGTVMIWHSLRAGKKGKEAQKKTGDEKSSDGDNKKKKKKKKGKDGEEGDEEEEVVEEVVMVEMKDKALKIGDRADPIKPVNSEPTPPGGALAATAGVQAVPTDPAPGDKTNPSLIPNDANLAPSSSAPDSNPAGTPLSPMQMVNMEMKKDDDHSITGAGGETAGGPGGTTAQ